MIQIKRNIDNIKNNEVKKKNIEKKLSLHME